jgi:mRNA interferase YafQ
MYQIFYTRKMKSDVKRMQKRGKDLSKLSTALSILASGRYLPQSNKDHPLTGNMSGFRECHIEADWLLIYRIEDERLILVAIATGTHADLFRL